MQDMLHFLPPYLLDYYQKHCRGEDDMLIQLGITFQRSMYNVTSAVIQALRTALLYPLDDPNPRHRMANRKFFEARWIASCGPKLACGIFKAQTTGKPKIPDFFEKPGISSPTFFCSTCSLPFFFS
jgi:hypothetical protein